MVEHGDLLSELKQVQEGLLGGFERELITPNTLLITGSGVRVPHHPLTTVSPRIHTEILMKPSEIQFAQNLQALSVPQCRRIVEALIEDSQTLKELSKLCKLSPASIDKHLEILIKAELVKVRTVGGVKKSYLQISKLKPTLAWFSHLNN